MGNLAPNNTAETAAFLKGKVESGTSGYYRKCLILQREARGIPALAPTAYTASQMVPKNERITQIKDVRRGMVGFSYDPRIVGTAGHIFFFNGRTRSDVILTTTNDAAGWGRVSVVPFSFYKEHWGHQFQFAATWLNGYDFSDFNKKPEPVHGSLGETYANEIENMERILKRKTLKLGPNHPLVKLLRRDVGLMKQRYHNWKP